VRKLVWVGATAFALGAGIFAWILMSAGFFGHSTQEKQGPETTFAPSRQGGSADQRQRGEVGQTRGL
jgi:hypothetical protein